MAEVIRMPRLSDTMEEGVIVEWHKKEGDKVSPGDVLAEVETDKATMDLESFHEGVLLHIGVKEGAVPVDGIIAVIGEKGEDYKKQLEAAKKDSPGSGKADDKADEGDSAKADEGDSAKTDKDKGNGQADEKGEKAGAASDDADDAGDDGDRVKASPLARKMAEEKGIDLSSIKGSGDNGRIVKRDIEEAKPQAGGAADFQAFSKGGYEEKAVSQMRKTIARRLGESKFSAPHFYLTVEINMGRMWEARKALNEVAPVKISFNDIIIKAVALSLKKHPAVNSSWMGDKIRYNKDIHIGVAVAVEEGLLVPVVRHADQKPMSMINEEVNELAEKAKNKKLSPEEMQGNTFTVSNLGMFGIEEFTAIINPPDACILAVGGIFEKPIVQNGQIVPGRMMKVTLSCDHRVVDGATGAKFLQTLKLGLENPIALLS
jgi:pyruvate dehydrogenase E2 component (dihydrolipoamide acetyltransferase)